jgi:hypothetical protein
VANAWIPINNGISPNGTQTNGVTNNGVGNNGIEANFVSLHAEGMVLPDGSEVSFR